MSTNKTSVDGLNQPSIIDDYGRPKDELTFKIVRLFFSPPFPPPKPSFTIKDVSILLAADFSKTESIIRQLTSEQILSEDPQNPGIFRYNYQCPYVEHQVRLEKYLLEEEMKYNLSS
ncbi:hypothetical protein ACFLZ8_03955 [Planctomycetota bacterium]